ncbi:amino acid ABC transporter substrate-binding protein [Pseudomonas sp. S60]|uniref:ABC transporter substrate-binding protein n=1 Tax=Pseudomonas sp. S60 TaxID=211124 RepID=UPI00191168F1|nr:ABC transporter substrate-binding protein [Pseudomonas sp. S60]MBK5009445.1 amino acid ABC transporter substrate-binding protein [Pseudomonas sp. S60]
MRSQLRALTCAAALAASFITGTAFSADTYRVGATATGVPFTFLDVKSNQIQGMMIDSAQAIAKAGGFDVTILQNNFSALIPSLTANKIDIISAAMLKTPEREKVVQYSKPVYQYGEALVVNQDDNGTYTSMDDFKGEVVGAQVGTVFIDELKRRGIYKEVRGYDSISDLLRDLALGRIKAGFADKPILTYQASQGLLKKVRLVDGYKPSLNGEVCLIVRKGDQQLLEQINRGIDAVKADGTLDAIIAKWHIN